MARRQTNRRNSMQWHVAHASYFGGHVYSRAVSHVGSRAYIAAHPAPIFGAILCVPGSVVGGWP